MFRRKNDFWFKSFAKDTYALHIDDYGRNSICIIDYQDKLLCVVNSWGLTKDQHTLVRIDIRKFRR